jgi:Fe-Mn family superoxide dismutase
MPITRRTVLRTTPLAAAGVWLPACKSTVAHEVPGGASTPGAPPMAEHAPKPLPFDPSRLAGLSEKLLRSHHENNYTGAVEKLNDVRRRLAEVTADTPGHVLHGLAQGEVTFKQSVVLHELYFGNLTGGGASGSVTTKLLADGLGGASAWESRFRALAASIAGGSGWTIVEYDLHERVPRMYTAADHAQGLSSGIPLLVLDMYEHAYHMDYGAAADGYVEAFFANVNWQEVDRRTELALRLPEGLY